MRVDQMDVRCSPNLIFRVTFLTVHTQTMHTVQIDKQIWWLTILCYSTCHINSNKNKILIKTIFIHFIHSSRAHDLLLIVFIWKAGTLHTSNCCINLIRKICIEFRQNHHYTWHCFLLINYVEKLADFTGCTNKELFLCLSTFLIHSSCHGILA